MLHRKFRHSTAPEPLVPRPDKPLASKLRDVNLQHSSPLYNGRIPSEIRVQIFEYALTEDDRDEYDPNTHYSRPGYRFRKGLSTNLLLTCRRVYLETHHLPLINKEHLFWHSRSPKHISYQYEEGYFSRFRPDQLALVKKVHLFTQQYWLEGSLQQTCKQEVMQGIEKMRITLRRGDWWFWESNNPLGINPQRGNSDVAKMRADWKLEEEGEEIPWAEDAWGSAFQHIRALKELELEFETSIYEKRQLEAIVEHAKKWRFPMGNGRVLSAEGQDVRTSTWRGPMTAWSNSCWACNKAIGTDCRGCDERFNLFRSQLGPILVVMCLRWKLAADDKGHR